MASLSKKEFVGSHSFGVNSKILFRTTSDTFRSDDVLTCASTSGFWEDDPEVKVKKKLIQLKREFHKGRQLQIKHLPCDVTEEEIRQLLSDFPVDTVLLNCGADKAMGRVNTVRSMSETARATLEEPEILEEWDDQREYYLRGYKVPVGPTSIDMLLCVARLPFTYTESQFKNLVAAYGEVQRSFLMITEKLGRSKGYGFVEYKTKEAALKAKQILQGMQIDDWTLLCDWLNPSIVTFESLHSTCLYVDKLPKDFRDMGKFRKLFSSIVNPPYCQIALKNGCPQDWGLVEFDSSEDAEAAQVALNGHSLDNQKIRVSYYIPGVRAINLYLKLLNETDIKEKGAPLLPNPPDFVVLQQFQSLAKQNPAFANSLQNIIHTQIQALQQKVEHVHNPKPGNISSGQTIPKNPQMLVTLQNLIKQGMTSTNTPVPGLLSPPFISSKGTDQFQCPTGSNSIQNAGHLHNVGTIDPVFGGTRWPQSVGLLPTPNSGMNPPHNEGTLFSNSSLSNSNRTSGMGNLHNPTDQVPSKDLQNFWNEPSRQIKKTQQSLPLNKNCGGTVIHPESSVFMNKEGGIFFPQLIHPNPSNLSIPPHMLKLNNQFSHSENVPENLHQVVNTILTQSQNLNQLLGSLQSIIKNNRESNMPPNTIMGYPFVVPPPMSPSIGIDPLWPGACSPSSVTNTSTVPVAQPILGQSMPMPIHKPIKFIERSPTKPHLPNNWNPNVFFNLRPPLPLPPRLEFNPMPKVWSPVSSPLVVVSSSPTYVTPIGQKRKYNRLLPLPEPSPEGNYIGQHSQGLGGHYADSYFKRKKTY